MEIHSPSRLCLHTTYQNYGFCKRDSIPPPGHHRFPNVAIRDLSQPADMVPPQEPRNQHPMSTPASAPVISVPPPMSNMYGVPSSAPPHVPPMASFHGHQWTPHFHVQQPSSSPMLHSMGNHQINGITNPIQAGASQVSSSDSEGGTSSQRSIKDPSTSSDSHQAGYSSVTSGSAQSGSDNGQPSPDLCNHQTFPKQGSTQAGHVQNGMNLPGGMNLNLFPQGKEWSSRSVSDRLLVEFS